jgi:tetratricopeptide (TPR) repeat protein
VSPGRADGARAALSALALAALAFGVFAPALGHGFLIYDDDLYVTGNRQVLSGFSAASVRWAFSTGHSANWHPLTWLSHMLDVELFGSEPRGHHLTSVLLHAANTALVFLVLRFLTGAFWASALVAALFGVHPTRIESVAWVAERKDVLSTLFALLALWAYGAWVRRPGAWRYAGALLAFGLGLLCKPMLVTLPFVLVLLDVWPLGRLAPSGMVRALLAKWPFLLLSLASSVVTFLVQRAGGAVGSLDRYPLDVRLWNAVVAYAGYLRRLLWPVGLAVFYPHPGRSLAPWKVAGALLLLGGLCLVAWAWRTRRPFVFVGWWWFAGMLVPVIGLVQVGFQALADRYTYLSFVGLFVALAWLLAEWAGKDAGRHRAIAAAVALSALAGCVYQTRVELVHWRDSETLFRRALAITRDNDVANQNLGHYLNETGRPAEAKPYLEEALRIRPRYAEARVNLGRSVFLLGDVDGSVPQFEQAIALRPDDPVSYNNLAYARMSQGELGEAVRLYARALALQADWAEVQHRAGIVQIMQGDWSGGGARLRRAAELEPSNLEYGVHAQGCAFLVRDRSDASTAAGSLREYLVVSHRQAAGVLAKRGRADEAVLQLRKAVELDPDRAELQEEIGVVLASLGRAQEAASAFEAALRRDPSLPASHNNLGFLLLQAGRREAAIAHFREALRLAPDFELARNNLSMAQEGNRRSAP